MAGLPQQNFQQQFERYLRTVCGLAPNRAVLLACSGGADSVVLGQLFHQIKQPFGIAYAQFSLRGTASTADEALVKELSTQWGVPFFRTNLEAKKRAASGSESLQMAARELRYSWFEQLRKEHEYHRIATAHHADDLAETTVMRLLGGSSIRGLRGILPARDRLIRPLLFARKSEILEFAKEQSLVWREDESNSSEEYRRNKIRLKVIPALESFEPGATERIIQSAGLLREAEKLYDAGLHTLTKSIVNKKGEEWHIGIKALVRSGAAATLLKEWLVPMGFTASQLQAVSQSLEGQPGAFWKSPEGTLYRDRANLLWVPGHEPTLPAPVEVDQAPAKVHTGNWLFTLSLVEKKRLKHPNPDRGILLDYHKLRFPLFFRRWTDGDYFFPEKTGKKRKIKRFLTDIKIAPKDKSSQLVLLSNEQIVWVVGQQADKRFVPGPASTTLLKIQIEERLP